MAATPAKTTSEVAVPEDRFPALSGSDTLDLLHENVGDSGISLLDLDRVKIPAGGGTTWEIPGLEGTRAERTLEGVIVMWRGPRLFWEKDADDGDGETTPPDCASEEGDIGVGAFGAGSTENPSGRCDLCPMNQWGSDLKGGKGKACRETRQLIMLLEGEVLPLSVSLPPTSITPMRKYMLRLAGAQMPYWSVVTKLTLEAQRSGSRSWSTVKAEKGATLSPELAAQAQAFGKQLRAAMASTGPVVAATAEPAE